MRRHDQGTLAGLRGAEVLVLGVVELLRLALVVGEQAAALRAVDVAVGAKAAAARVVLHPHQRMPRSWMRSSTSTWAGVLPAQLQCLLKISLALFAIVELCYARR